MESATPAPIDGPGEAERLAGRLHRLLEVLPAGVVMLDAHGRVEEANPAAVDLLGRDPAGAPWREVLATCFALDAAGPGADVSLADGRRVEVRTCPIGAEPGQLVLLTEVTETRALQDRIERMRRIAAMGDMVGAVAHQIRTPLASALLYASGLRNRLPEGDDAAIARRACDRITERLRHLESLLEDMLAFARRGAFCAERLDLGEVVSAAAVALEPQLQAAGARLRIGRIDAQCVVDGNRDALASALQSLVLNALEAGGPGTRVDVECRAEGDRAVLAVCDDGPGVPAGLRERVFEPFFTTRAGGNGLGLAIVRGMIEAHRGTVALDEAPGGGARFTLSVPIARARAGRLGRAA